MSFYALFLSKGLLHPRPISSPLTDHLVWERVKVALTFQQISPLFSFSLFKFPWLYFRIFTLKRNTTEACRSKRGKCAQSITCIRVFHNPLGLKRKQRRAVFGSLSRRHLTNTNKSQNIIGNQKLFNGECLVVEEDFLIL